MAEVRIEETNWEELEQIRQEEPNSYSYRQAMEAYQESKEEEYY